MRELRREKPCLLARNYNKATLTVPSPNNNAAAIGERRYDLTARVVVNGFARWVRTARWFPVATWQLHDIHLGFGRKGGRSTGTSRLEYIVNVSMEVSEIRLGVGDGI